MSSEKYPVGKKVIVNEITGTIVENVKLPDDICVTWEGNSGVYSYDEEWLDKNIETAVKESQSE